MLVLKGGRVQRVSKGQEGPKGIKGSESVYPLVLLGRFWTLGFRRRNIMSSISCKIADKALPLGKLILQCKGVHSI